MGFRDSGEKVIPLAHDDHTCLTDALAKIDKALRGQ